MVDFSSTIERIEKSRDVYALNEILEEFLGCVRSGEITLDFFETCALTEVSSRKYRELVQYEYTRFLG